MTVRVFVIDSVRSPAGVPAHGAEHAPGSPCCRDGRTVEAVLIGIGPPHGPERDPSATLVDDIDGPPAAALDLR
jgi:hypothetical protein